MNVKVLPLHQDDIHVLHCMREREKYIGATQNNVVACMVATEPSDEVHR